MTTRAGAPDKVGWEPDKVTVAASHNSLVVPWSHLECMALQG